MELLPPVYRSGGAILITQRIKGERVIAWRVELGMDLGKYCNANNWQRETIARKFARLQATEERPSEVPAFGYC